MTFEEFKTVFHDVLMQQGNVPELLTKTLADLFEGAVTKVSAHQGSR